MFEDREDAGRKLAVALLGYRTRRPIILALPRGGVPVGYQVADALGAPLDIVLVRKIGMPFQPELALGAIVDGEHPEILIDDCLKSQFAIPDAYIEDESKRQLAEIERRRLLYLEGRQPVPLIGRTAIVVDDGIATGATMRAALMSIRRRQPASLVLAVPVAPAHTIEALRSEVDDIVCLSTPDDFAGVGQFYRNFRQVADADVASLLRAAARGTADVGAGRNAYRS